MGKVVVTADPKMTVDVHVDGEVSGAAKRLGDKFGRRPNVIVVNASTADALLGEDARVPRLDRRPGKR